MATTEDLLGPTGAAELLADVLNSEPKVIRPMLYRSTWLENNDIPYVRRKDASGKERLFFPRIALQRRVEDLRQRKRGQAPTSDVSEDPNGRNVVTDNVTNWQETVTLLLHEIRDGNQSTRNEISSALRLIADSLEATESGPHE